MIGGQKMKPLIEKELDVIVPDQEHWKPFSWHCPNCGTIVTGHQNNAGKIKAECHKCHTVMVRIIKSRRYDSIDVYAPKGQVNQSI